MQTPDSASVLRHLRALIVAGVDAAPDRELLERFSRGRDEEAFAALLRRHGPMVWRVCRRLAPCPADAEDAFQSTFMRLAQHAGSIRAGESASAPGRPRRRPPRGPADRESKAALGRLAARP